MDKFILILRLFSAVISNEIKKVGIALVELEVQGATASYSRIALRSGSGLFVSPFPHRYCKR